MTDGTGEIMDMTRLQDHHTCIHVYMFAKIYKHISGNVEMTKSTENTSV